MSEKVELLNIDCLQYMKECKTKSFDLAIVDPPYLDSYNAMRSLNSDDRKDYDYSSLTNSVPTDEYWKELFRVSKNQIIWGGNYFADKLPVSRCWIFWDKVKHIPNYADGELAWTSFDRNTKLIRLQHHGWLTADKKQGELEHIHPTQKPVALYTKLLELFSQKGERIIDTHLGSASSGIAAYFFGVEFIGCEINKYYYDKAVERYKRVTSQTKLTFQ